MSQNDRCCEHGPLRVRSTDVNFNVISFSVDLSTEVSPSRGTQDLFISF
jgi:hypothetical protein